MIFFIININQFISAQSICNYKLCNYGGMCSVLPQQNDITCTCLESIASGKYCENRNNFCDSNPCENNGKCM